MRFESSVTSVSWIPSGCVDGITKILFEVAWPTTTRRRRT